MWERSGDLLLQLIVFEKKKIFTRTNKFNLYLVSIDVAQLSLHCTKNEVFH